MIDMWKMWWKGLKWTVQTADKTVWLTQDSDIYKKSEAQEECDLPGSKENRVLYKRECLCPDCIEGGSN